MARNLLLTLALAALTLGLGVAQAAVGLVPPNARCDPVQNAEENLPILGLTANPSRHCLTARANPSTTPGAVVQRFRLPDLPLGESVRFVLWNGRRKPDATWRTTVTFDAPTGSGQRAQGFATVAAGQVTQLTITNPGWGYTVAPGCTISYNGYTPAPTALAGCVAAIGSTGKVVKAVVTAAGAGYPPSVGNDVFDTGRIARFELVYTQHLPTGPSPVRISLRDATLPAVMDSARCPCTDPSASGCLCIPTGIVSAPNSLPVCGSEAFVEVEAAAEVEYAIAAVHAPARPREVMPSLPLGQKTQFFTALGAPTDIKIDANGTDFLYRYVKALRVTLDTPLSAQWFCDDADNRGFSGDCAVRHRQLANITLDVSRFPLYHSPPLVRVDPPRRGILSVDVSTGGDYTSRPTVSINRANPSGRMQVQRVQVLSGGRGYVRPPRVVFSGAGGAAATATIDANGVVTGVNMDNSGDFYTSRPTVTFQGEMEVSSITVRNGGSGYSSASPPIVVIGAPSRAGGQNAVATASVDAQGRIEAITVTTPGHGYESVPSVTLARRVYAVTITSGGSGYTAPPTVTFSGGACTGTGAIAEGTAIIDAGTGAVTGVTINPAVFRTCTTAPTVTFDPPDTAGATATGTALLTPGNGDAVVVLSTRWLHDATAIGMAEMNPERSASPRDAVLRAVMEREEECKFGGRVVSVEVIEPGSDYVSGDTLVFSAGTVTATGTFVIEAGATPAKATASIDGDKLVSAVTVTQAGSGYSAATPPAVQLFSTGRVLSVKVTNQGSGYTSVPTVSFGTGAARATAAIANGRVTAITVTDPGAWYTSGSPPSVTISPRQEIASISLTTKGSGYDPASPPLVWITSTGGGSGAKAVAEVGPSGCLTGIRVTVPGSGYDSATTTVTIQSPPTGVTATASAIIGGGSGATAIAIVEDGQGAEAVATVNAAGGVSGITVTKKGLTYGAGNPAPVPAVGGSGLTFAIELSDAGVPTGRVITKGTRSGTWSSPPTVSWSPSAPPGVTATAFLGSGSASLYSGNTLLRLVTGNHDTSFSGVAPTQVTYTPASKTFVYELPAQYISNVPYYYLSLAAPVDGSRKFFPKEEFVSNNVFGANNALNALFLPASVQVDVEYYPELYQQGLVSGRLAKDETIVYQVSVPRDWSRINLTYAAAEGAQGSAVLGLRYRSSAGTSACGADSWCTVSANGLILRRSSYSQLAFAPNTHVSPLLIQVSVASCRGAANAVFDFTIEAEVTEYATEGECNSHFDCQHNPGRSHPTPGARVGVSANGNHARFDKCVVDPRLNSQHNGICVECTSDCHCPTGQYCHSDNGMPSVSGGYAFVGDPWSAERYGTCQRKDSVGDILGQTCREIPESALFQYGQPGINTQQFCGKALYYNDSYEDPGYVNNRRGERRLTLWAGYCHNHVCRECSNEGNTDCTGRRICVDGFWQEKSGNSQQGAYAMAQAKTVKDAVTDGNAVTGSMLAFVILIAISMGVGVFCLVRKRK